MMRLVTVGTGTVTPHAQRTSAAHWVEIGADASARTQGFPAAPLAESHAAGGAGVGFGVRLLLDCGAGTCHRLAGCGLTWFDITHIAITHFHADHYGELPALLFAMKYGAERPRAAPLTIAGPVGLRARLDALAAAFGEWVTEPGWPLDIVEIAPEAGAGDVASVPGSAVPVLGLAPGVTLTACKTPHTDESLAFAVATAGHRLVYTGDTGPSEALGDWARPCDLLLAECSLPDDRALDIHLTPAQAGTLAGRANAKRLVLTHLYPPVERTDILGQVARAYRGPAVVAADGDRFEIPG